MRRMLSWVLVVAALTALALPVQAANLKELLGGKDLPLTMQLKDLNSDWIRVTVGDQSGTGGIGMLYSAMLGGSTSAGAYYTKGETVSLGGVSYMVAYQIQPKPLDYTRLMSSSRPPTPEKPTAESIVSLSLLNLRAITSLNDVRPFNLEQELSGPAEVEKALATETSLSNLKQLGLGLIMYASDYDEVLPKEMGNSSLLQQKLEPYVKETKLFINPITNKPYASNAILAGKKIAHIADPAQMATLYEDAPAPDGTRGVVFLDGHAKRVNEAQWETIKKISKIP